MPRTFSPKFRREAASLMLDQGNSHIDAMERAVLQPENGKATATGAGQVMFNDILNHHTG